MKRIVLNLLMVLVTASTIWFTACKKEKDKLSVSPVKIDFTADDTNAKPVTVDTNAKEWDATPSSGWIIVSKGEGMFTVKVENNTSTSADRNGTITVKAGAAKQIIVDVHQSAAVVNTLSLSTTSLTFEAEDTDTKDVVIVTNSANWNFTGAPAWLTLVKDGLTLHVTPTGLNFSSAPRTATITITAGNATPVPLQVTQEVTHIVYTSFDRAIGYYFGNVGAGTAFFGLDMYNASDDMVGMNIMGFSKYASAGKFKLDAGTYTLTEFGEAKSFLDGEYDSEEDEPFGSFAYDFNLNKFTLITGGTFDVALSGNKYTITTNFTGKDAFTNATVNNIRYSYTGTIEFEDNSIDMSSTGIVESDYTATGTPQLSFSGGDVSASEWDGSVVPVDDDDFGQYIAITNFADEELTIFADFIFGEFVLDTYYPVWEDANYVGFLEIVFYYDDDLWGVDPDLWDRSIQYDDENQTIDFSKSYTFSDIGLQNFSVGVYAYQKSDGKGVAWLSNIYPDIKLALTPKVVSASKSSAKTILNKKAIFSKIKSLTRTADKNLITIDKSKLVPVDKKKLNGVNLSDGKSVDRKTFQKTIKK